MGGVLGTGWGRGKWPVAIAERETRARLQIDRVREWGWFGEGRRVIGRRGEGGGVGRGIGLGGSSGAI